MQEQKTKLFTEEEMTTVRHTDLPDLLTSLGYQVTNVGQFQSTKEMDSIRIKNRMTFYRYSEGVGGDAITFMEYYHNMTFEEAVRHGCIILTVVYMLSYIIIFGIREGLK